MTKDLTDAVLDYQKTGKNWQELSEKIYLKVYQYPSNTTNWDHDQCCDFFMAFIPKIPGLVLRFKPLSFFESYLLNSLQWYMKTFTESLASKEHYEAWTESEGIMTIKNLLEKDLAQQEIDIEDSPLIYCPLPVDDKGRIADAVMRNRLIFAILTYADDIIPDRIPTIAQLTCVDSLWLENMLEIARKTILEKTIRRANLRNRRNECWYNMIRIQRRIENSRHLDSMIIDKWKKKYQFWKKRYTAASHSLSRLKIRVSASDTGRILKIPESTIVSGLNALRRYWTKYNNEE